MTGAEIKSLVRPNACKYRFASNIETCKTTHTRGSFRFDSRQF